VRRGDVVEVGWQYTDMSLSKLRPAVVVQGDFLNGLIDDTILVQVTSTRHGIPGTEVLLNPAVETGSGLRPGTPSNLESATRLSTTG
jgi:mRNA-degrading endonuclease toxin of MazEF toxin-antitoxin module